MRSTHFSLCSSSMWREFVFCIRCSAIISQHASYSILVIVLSAHIHTVCIVWVQFAYVFGSLLATDAHRSDLTAAAAHFQVEREEEKKIAFVLVMWIQGDHCAFSPQSNSLYLSSSRIIIIIITFVLRMVPEPARVCVWVSDVVVVIYSCFVLFCSLALCLKKNFFISKWTHLSQLSVRCCCCCGCYSWLDSRRFLARLHTHTDTITRRDETHTPMNNFHLADHKRLIKTEKSCSHVCTVYTLCTAHDESNWWPKHTRHNVHNSTAPHTHTLTRDRIRHTYIRMLNGV